MTNTLGQAIRERRSLAGLSQRSLADKVGTTQQRIALWELDHADPSIHFILKLCQALNCTPNDLLL